MGSQNDGQEGPTPEVAVAVYEPPKVESVLTAEDLAREIQYAGQPSFPG